jgi:toxin ParE1/3/4
MKTVVFRPRATSDLEVIWDYTVAGWGVEQAESYTRTIWNAVSLLSIDPRRARPCDDVRAGYMRYAVGSHVIFMRQPDENTLEIVRILHQRMDPRRHF